MLSQGEPRDAMLLQGEVEVEVEKGSLVPSMRETGPEGH